MAISRADPKRAGAALSRLLNAPANSRVKQVVEASIRASSKSAHETKDLIIEGICSSIEHNTRFVRGSQTKAEETFVKNIALAIARESYVFDHINHDDQSRLDTNQGKVEVIHLFLSSDEFAKFQRENNGATVGYTVWADVLKEVNMFVSNPRPESPAWEAPLPTNDC